MQPFLLYCWVLHQALQEELRIFLDGCHKASDIRRRAAARGFLEELSARAQRLGKKS